MPDFEILAFTPAPFGAWFVRLDYADTPTNWVDVRPVAGWLTLRLRNGMTVTEAAWMDADGEVRTDTTDAVINRLGCSFFSAPLSAEDTEVLYRSLAAERQAYLSAIGAGPVQQGGAQ